MKKYLVLICITLFVSKSYAQNTAPVSSGSNQPVKASVMKDRSDENQNMNFIADTNPPAVVYRASSSKIITGYEEKVAPSVNHNSKTENVIPERASSSRIMLQPQRQEEKSSQPKN